MKYYFLALGTLIVVCVGCISDGQGLKARNDYHAPPAAMMTRPGPMVDGPGPGVMNAMAPPMGVTPAGYGAPGPMPPGMPPGVAPNFMPPGVVPGAPGAPGVVPVVPGAPPVGPLRSQVRFVRPVGMRVGWFIGNGYAENQLVAPSRYDFVQGATYRLKLTNIPGREGSVLYPNLQLYPAHPTTLAYLENNTIPLELTDEDLDQVESNNFVTKVIYLPDPRFQELAIAGVETLVSTRLEPGVDPVAEAERRGTIMAVLRVGNIDQEMPNRLPLDHPNVGVNNGELNQVAYKQVVDGENNQFMEPAPIMVMTGSAFSVPNPVIAAGQGMPGMPPFHPIAGMGPAQMWGQPITATPIGLPGPPHLPLGGPAGLKSHTMRNNTPMHVPDPVDHMLIDVSHKPGINIPKPVKYIRYEENHPSYAPGEVSAPAWATGADPSNPAYCPPGQ